MDRAPLIYLNVYLKDTASFLLLSRDSFWINYASHEYKNKYANKGAQLVPIGMLTDYWKIWSPKTIHILSTRKLIIPLMPSSEYLYELSEWCHTKYVYCFQITRNLYFRAPSLFKNNYLWPEIADVLICCEELLDLVWRNHMFWCCQFSKNHWTLNFIKFSKISKWRRFIC
jgi:hypothetical protein